jgi:hypothetical protein
MKATACSTWSNHHVQFYDSDQYLTEIVTHFVAAAFAAGDPVIVIGTLKHRESFAAALNEQGFDTAALTRTGDFILLDAHQTLSTFLRNGVAG